MVSIEKEKSTPLSNKTGKATYLKKRGSFSFCKRYIMKRGAYEAAKKVEN